MSVVRFGPDAAAQTGQAEIAESDGSFFWKVARAVIDMETAVADGGLGEHVVVKPSPEHMRAEVEISGWTTRATFTFFDDRVEVNVPESHHPDFRITFIVLKILTFMGIKYTRETTGFQWRSKLPFERKISEVHPLSVWAHFANRHTNGHMRELESEVEAYRDERMNDERVFRQFLYDESYVNRKFVRRMQPPMVPRVTNTGTTVVVAP